MKISMILAWCTVICVLLTAMKYLARISKNPKCNQLFHKIHIPTGILALIFGLLHGLLAGNIPGGKVFVGTILLTPNWGSLCFLLMLLLLLSYLLRKQLKKAWLPLHRILTILLLAAVILHLVDVGIHVFDREPSYASAITPIVSVSVTTSPEAATPTAVETPTATVPVTPTPSADEIFSVSEPEEFPLSNAEPTPTLEPTPEPTPQVEFSGAVLADGVYQGSAEGYKSTITVEVTVEQGQVSAISVLEQNDTPNFYANAATIPDTVVETQSLQVDAVTGATYSSAGLLNAIENALSGAVVEGELQVNEAMDNLSAKGGHGKH